jgi:hypothetical protein
MALAALGAPALWLALWQGGVLVMAVAAPLLGIARIARAVRCGAVEDEFARWFRPIDPATPAAATPGHRPRPVVSPNEVER